jgi:hypothetical protein
MTTVPHLQIGYETVARVQRFSLELRTPLLVKHAGEYAVPYGLGQSFRGILFIFSLDSERNRRIRQWTHCQGGFMVRVEVAAI